MDHYNASHYSHTLYTHQTAYHAVPAAINTANQAILRKRTSDDAASIDTTIYWYPSLVNTKKEGDVEE